MAGKLTNELGTVLIENEVISRIAGLAAIECYGVVGMAAKNMTDGLVQLLKRESLTKGIKILMT
ncbi:MAG: Asp23/Gls24 family envelope stress response protein, partial [Epulopiscium sp.]|nr:Asp23/Gls24 family envelope stress response protein [Candidatus Epulonipiscium sp.]